MQNSVIPQQKQLSRKRFIPMLLIFCLGITLFFFKNSTRDTILLAAKVLESNYRESLIHLIAVTIGILHFYHVGRKNVKHKEGIIRTVTGVFSSIGTSIGFSFMMNKSFNFALGVAYDFFAIKPYFINNEKVDHIPIMLATVLLIFLSGYSLWKMAEDFLFDFAIQPVEANAGTAEALAQNQEISNNKTK